MRKPRYSSLMMSMALIAALTFISSCGGGSSGSGSGSATWYANWSCGSSSQCATVMGGYSGSQPLSSQSACQSWCATYIPGNCSCSNSQGDSPPAPANLVSISVSPSNSTLPRGLTRQFTATGNYSDGTSKDITAQVTWSANCGGTLCTPAPPASIGAGGLATSSAAGWITIYATLGSITGNTRLTITAATLQSITVTPADPTVNQYLTQQFTATGHYSDGSTQTLNSVAWNSGTAAVATISPSGLAACVAGGTSTITATLAGISGSTTLTVATVPLQTITVMPANPGLSKGTTGQFTAMGNYADGSARDISSQVTWNSDTPAVAGIDTNGLTTALAIGTSNITAIFGAISGYTTLTVTAAVLQSITITPAGPRVAAGLTKQLTATGSYSDGSTQDITTQVTWSSGTMANATINSSGLAFGVAAGTSTITATIGPISGTTTLTVATPGANWIQPSSGTTNPLYGVAWSGTQFVAVGASGTILTSPDGSTWTPRTSGTTNTLNAVILAGAQLVAVGSYGTVLTSPDGIAWTLRSSAAAFSLNALAWTGTLIVAVGNGGSTSLTSPDGITWQLVSPPYNSWTDNTMSIAWNGTYYLVGATSVSNYVNYPDAFYTTALTGWSYLPGLSTFNYGSIWTGAQFVVVQSGGGIKTSPDLSTWYGRTSGSSANLRAVAWSGSHYVVVGDTGTILTSPDSIAWTSRTSGTTHILRGVAWSGASFVAVGDLGAILVTSP